MKQQIKSCARCGEQNFFDARFCLGCGTMLPAQTFMPSVKKKSSGLMIVMVIFSVMFGGYMIFRIFAAMIGSNKTKTSPSALTPMAPSPTLRPTSTLNVPGDEKQSRAAPTRGMPAFAQVSNAASKLGFQLGAFNDGGGSIYMADAARFIGGQEFKLVVMGPARDRVDTIRIQSWGFQTKQARQQLERWATQVLVSLNRGRLPRDFIRQLYAGSNVGDDGVSNGFCNVQVLQRPITPGVPNANDRITIDLIFDKMD
jgi:hypothetical protein